MRHMKKFTILICLIFISSSILLAQSNADVDINAKTNPHATTFTDDLFDEQFQFLCGGYSGEAGIETNGEYIYTSKWNGDKFLCYEMDGTFLGEFSIPGVSGVRDMAYDGTYFYGAAANTALFEMDFDGQSGVLVSILTAAVATRACAYDAEFDGFWGNNWSDPITLYDRIGGILNQFNCGVYSFYYGFACLNDAGNEWLYGFAQSGGASQAIIVQIDPYSGAETGVTFDAIGYSTSGIGIAGGLAAFDTWAPGWWTLLGIVQNETIFGVDGGIAVSPPELDLALTGIPEPNTGFWPGIENIVVRIKNQGTITQGNFEVRYRVDDGEWVSEIVPGPIVYIESIDYTFNEPYDFTEYKSFHIEAEVLLTGDEFPENNFSNKWMEILNPIEWCEYSITMWDDYGNGWNGGYVQIFGDGVGYINATLAAGAGPETIEFFVEDEASLTAFWIAGGCQDECSYAVFDADGNLIFEDGMGGIDPVGGDIGYAICVPPPPIDGGTVEIISPETGVFLSIEPVTVIFKNFGSNPILDIPVGFNLDGTGWIYEVIPDPARPGEEIEYTFTTTVDLTETGTYFIEVCTFVPDDGDPLNDCQDKEIVHECYYCEAFTITEDEYISNVLMGQINNSSGWQGGTADYTDQFTIVEVGLPQEIVVTNGNPWEQDNVTVWIDWNEDCIFEQGYGSNEEFPLINNGTGLYFTGDIIAPPDAIEGSHRMRIRMTYSVQPSPCCSSSYGEAEDYTCVVGDLSFPEIITDQYFFRINLPVGGITQEYLEIGNIGDISLSWNIEVSYGPMETSVPGKVNKKAKPNASITDEYPKIMSDWGYDCPEGSVVSQSCPDYSNAMVADEAAYYDFYQSFTGGVEINGIRFWGIDAYNDGTAWTPCTGTEPKTFHFGFFADDGGQPGAMIDEFTLEVPRVNTGDLFVGTYSMFEYEAAFPYSVSVIDGWFSIMALSDSTPCWFLALNAPSGLGVGQQWDGTAWNQQDPMGFCLLGEVIDPWLTVYPLEGIVEPQCTEDINLNINAMDYPNGTVLIADIILSSNDPFNLEIIIPVEMTIGSPIVNQTFDLEAYFQFISANVIPDSTDMMAILSEILNDNLDFVRNSQGQTIRKIGSTWVNGIGDWIIEEGYLIKMFNEDSFTIEGQFVDPSTPIFVNEGFQFVSYFPNTTMDALIAFETIICDNLDFIRNSLGQTLRKIGPNWINGIGDCQTNEAYLVKMFSDDILIYPFSCGYPFIDPRDEQIYKTVQIGDQCWMAENLNIGQMINGSEDMTDDGVIEKYCYDNDPYYCEVYGGLYQWNEMMEYTITPGVQGICPEGWYIPTDDEWSILEGMVDSQYPIGDPIWTTSGYRGFDAGLNLKSTNTWFNNGNGTDLYGFMALPGGHRNTIGNFYTMDSYGNFWSSSSNSTISSWYRFLCYSRNDIGRSNGSIDAGLSVRCLKNNSNSYPFLMGKQSKNNELLNQKDSNIETVHFLFNGGNAADPVYTIYIDGLNVGDEIAAFDGETFVGAMKIISENKYENELPIFSTLNKGKGYTPGNPIILKAWNKTENKEYIVKDFTFLDPYGDAWTENVFPAEDGEYSLLNFSTTGILEENAINDISIYPNPTTGIITIGNLNLSGFQNLQGLEITNITGKIVFQSEITNYQSSIEIDLSQLEKGVYFINFKGKTFSRVKKIVIK